MSYRYWLLRYVPDPVRGEFVNLGVIVGDGECDWAIRRVHNFKRASRLGGDASLAADWLERLERRFPQLPDEQPLGTEALLSYGWLEHTRARLNNSIQVSQSAPVSARSAKEAAERLYGFLVKEDQNVSRSGWRATTTRELRRQYEMRMGSKSRSLQSNVYLQARAQRTRFEFALGDDLVVHLTRVWAFDVASTENLRQQIQAWSYAVKVFRERGGDVRNRAHKVPSHPVQRDVPISILYQNPRTDQQQEVFQIAADAWKDLEVNAFAQGNEFKLVDRALTTSMEP
ncbi:Protein of unknown function (DUF3037) [Mumia flava]|uniref:DUF3037 family protein n=2 Tax=Mumia flava TaxID=1348852 RepID=A0A2M9BJD2_9ACTN|nr:Protein of unknown function (DUF3037) [Mumia flava]